MRTSALLLALGLCSLAFSGSSDAAIVVGGTAFGRATAALDTLGLSYSVDGNSTLTIDPVGLGAGDVIIIGNDGGLDDSYADYNDFLNSGGCLIMMGGSSWDPFRTWLSGYFTLDPDAVAAEWIQGFNWVRTAAHPVTQYLPADYTFESPELSYRMIAFEPAADTTLLGIDAFGDSIAAIRTYANGGAFIYMGFDIGADFYGTAGDQANFVVPFFQGALEKTAVVPEPSTVAGALLGLAGAGVSAMRRRRVG
ncbi:MAG: PEP-CTERM sorting domain-containing protein [Isosphaeraceae bacterium]|nr:PEP-CTERM sorting domain-containing protein [Isosphaeraceae bacterium]